MGAPRFLSLIRVYREFVNEISSQLYAITKTEHRITSAYHPQVYLYYYAVMVEFNKFYIPILQTNGLTERFNQTLSRCLAKIIDEDKLDWDDKLDTVLMGYRASQQASTKQSPYFMMFQQQMRLPIDAEILPESSPHDEEHNHLEETVGVLLESRNQAFQKAQMNITKAQKQQKETYDRKHLQKELEVGTKVLLENTAQQQRKGGKMEPLRLGPYIINQCLGKGIYELKNMKGEVLKKKANIARLTVFKERAEPPSSNPPSPASKGQETSGKRAQPPSSNPPSPASKGQETSGKQAQPPSSDPPSPASKGQETSRKRHPSKTIHGPKSGKRYRKHQVTVSDDESDSEGKSNHFKVSY